MANTIKENKAAIEKLWQVVDQQRAAGTVDPEAFRDLIAEDYIEHQDLGQGGGYDGWLKRVEWIIQAFPDFNIDMKLIIGEDDLVVCFYEDRGTFKGEFLGIPPTNQKYIVEVAHIFKMKYGKAMEHWAFLPGLELFSQIGIIDQVVAGIKAQQ